MLSRSGIDTLPIGLLIDGQVISESTGGVMKHVDPATGNVQRVFPVAGADEIDQAVRSARAALLGYQQWNPTERRDVLRRIAELFRENGPRIAALSTAECGMVHAAAGIMGAVAASWFDYYAGWTDKLTGEVIPGANFNYTLLEPCGVVAVILTWNGPTGAIGMKVAAALAAGCTVVLKPPELAPFSSTIFGEICQQAGVPEGVINIVPGGAEAGAALVSHPGIDKISFTGGPQPARRIQAAAATSLTPLLLELGGKSANIVFEDADLESASDLAAQAIIRMSGQVCHAPTRLLVQSSVYDRVVAQVSRRLEDVRVGLPADPETEMGPVINDAACDRILSFVSAARDQQMGQLLTGGSRVGGALSGGYFIRPTAFADVDNHSSLAQDEVFGPVLAISRFQDEDEAIAVANDSVYGLAGHVHTTDLARAHRVAAQLNVGNVAINGGLANAGPTAPFGGVKDSGYGKEGGRAGIEEYCRIKNVNIRTV